MWAKDEVLCFGFWVLVSVLVAVNIVSIVELRQHGISTVVAVALSTRSVMWSGGGSDQNTTHIDWYTKVGYTVDARRYVEEIDGEYSAGERVEIIYNREWPERLIRKVDASVGAIVGGGVLKLVFMLSLSLIFTKIGEILFIVCWVGSTGLFAALGALAIVSAVELRQQSISTVAVPLSTRSETWEDPKRNTAYTVWFTKVGYKVDALRYVEEIAGDFSAKEQVEIRYDRERPETLIKKPDASDSAIVAGVLRLFFGLCMTSFGLLVWRSHF